MTKELSIEEMMEISGEMEDQTQEVSHGEFNNVPEAGVTVGRLISYIELGKHDGGAYQGKKKPDADKVRLEFELLGPTNWIEWEVDGVQKKAGQVVNITIKKSLSDKGLYRKLFKKMQYGREDKNHLAKMLGEAFVITIYHNIVKKDGKDKTYVNLHLDGEFGISAPFTVDPITKNRQFYDVPAKTQPLRMFLWDKPQHSNWDALFIDGTTEKKAEDGTVTNVSKNWLQEMILSAKNFNGSKLQQLLAGVANLPTSEAQVQSESHDPTVQQAQQAAQQQEQPKVETPAEQPAAAQQPAADPLAALGFK